MLRCFLLESVRWLDFSEIRGFQLIQILNPEINPEWISWNLHTLGLGLSSSKVFQTKDQYISWRIRPFSWNGRKAEWSWSHVGGFTIGVFELIFLSFWFVHVIGDRAIGRDKSWAIDAYTSTPPQHTHTCKTFPLSVNVGAYVKTLCRVQDPFYVALASSLRSMVPIVVPTPTQTLSGNSFRVTKQRGG